jgi:hypothetical protein
VVRVWLIDTNCSRLLIAVSWFTYSFGSVCDVGSWFFISVTSSVRKSFELIVAVEVELELDVVAAVEADAPTPAAAALLKPG